MMILHTQYYTLYLHEARVTAHAAAHVARVAGHGIQALHELGVTQVGSELRVACSTRRSCDT